VAIDPRPAAITFVTTEHFALEGARAATVTEATGRATIFLSSVSGGLISLGLIANVSGLGVPFECFALIVLAVLTLIGFVTFERTLQTGIADHEYARRIARLRAYYLYHAPELAPYLESVSLPERPPVSRLVEHSQHTCRTVSGMVSIITAALAGSASAVICLLALAGSTLVSGLVGVLTFMLVLFQLMRFERQVWSAAIANHREA
jgi:hypothetical protein